MSFIFTPTIIKMDELVLVKMGANDQNTNGRATADTNTASTSGADAPRVYVYRDMNGGTHHTACHEHGTSIGNIVYKHQHYGVNILGGACYPVGNQAAGEDQFMCVLNIILKIVLAAVLLGVVVCFLKG